MIRSLLLALALLPFSAMAGEALVSWGAPTERTDGTPLPAAELAGYTVYWGPTSRGYTGEAVVDGGGTLSYRVIELPPGTWYFAVIARTTDGLQSTYSAEVSKTIEAVHDPLPPMPPDPVIIPAGETQFAYIINQAEGRLTLVPAGTVAAGTVCDASQAIRDSNGLTMFRIPDSAVAWSGTVRRSLVFSPCGN